MIKGARQLPALHLSVRVPWHDARWAGTVCKNPLGNTSCLILPKIAEGKDDAFEAGIANKAWDSGGTQLPACAVERGAFMSATGYSRRVQHPYSKNADGKNGLYGHFRASHFRHPPYSAGVVPFAWMMKERDGIPEKANAYKIAFRPELEPELEFDKLWI